MLRRPPTTITLTPVDIAIYEANCQRKQLEKQQQLGQPSSQSSNDSEKNEEKVLYQNKQSQKDRIMGAQRGQGN